MQQAKTWENVHVKQGRQLELCGGPFLQQLLKLQRLRESKRKKDLNLYRFFLARADEICGKAICNDTMEEFWRKYMFSSPNDAIQFQVGMTGLADSRPKSP